MSGPESDLEEFEVLLVDDSPGDVRLTQEAFRSADRAVNLLIATDGVEAMDFLRQQGGRSEAPRPDLVLLDLNLPRMDGREVLTKVKGDDRLKTIPVVILTTSDAETDIEECYRLHANSYLVKPAKFEDFERLVHCIGDFWLTNSERPKARFTK